MADVPPDVEQQLADMSPGEWASFAAKVRPPDHAEAFRDTASKFISGDRLTAICRIVDHSLYVGDDGDIDAGKVESQLRAMFDDIPPAAPVGTRWQSFGQHAPAPPSPGPGERGAAEARKRFHGAKPPAGSRGGRAEAEKRFGRPGGN